MTEDRAFLILLLVAIIVTLKVVTYILSATELTRRYKKAQRKAQKQGRWLVDLEQRTPTGYYTARNRSDYKIYYGYIDQMSGFFMSKIKGTEGPFEPRDPHGMYNFDREYEKTKFDKAAV